MVPATAEQLRQRIFACPAGEQIGSLPELAAEFGVGIVTVQQAARILEHEGLLEVRRGPGGGYYGRRPDLASLERGLAAYMRSEPASQREVLDMTSLLFNELCAAAANSRDAARLDDLRRFADKVERCDDPQAIGPLEEEMQNLLFRMVNRPLFELLTRVALQLATSPNGDGGGNDGDVLGVNFGLEQWQSSRRHILDAIIRQDPELAHFEANRRNRRTVIAFSQRLD